MVRHPQQRDLFIAQAAKTRPPTPRQYDLMTGKTTRPAYYGDRVVPNGYAAKPGTGPAGETCATCKHLVTRPGTKHRYYKCALMRETWTHGRGSDVAYRSPACEKWEASDV